MERPLQKPLPKPDVGGPYSLRQTDVGADTVNHASTGTRCGSGTIRDPDVATNPLLPRCDGYRGTAGRVLPSIFGSCTQLSPPLRAASCATSLPRHTALVHCVGYRRRCSSRAPSAALRSFPWRKGGRRSGTASSASKPCCQRTSTAPQCPSPMPSTWPFTRKCPASNVSGVV